MAQTQEYQLIVLQPQGHLDLQHSQVLKAKLSTLEPQSNYLWVIDLAQVDFMDSAGFSTLVTSLSTAISRGCHLVLCNLQAPIRIIFELTQMDLVFEIFENYNDILSKFNSQQSNID